MYCLETSTGRRERHHWPPHDDWENHWIGNEPTNEQHRLYRLDKFADE
jgi:hypothetical protein